ncbi:MAG: segregation/condensation protein A [Candidatus Nanohaloarchaeota archaeon QJJ-9]|nr:segregation/condensation protein A [Candidatus Nanohaloarchaeota archaeon QJJ-9]
MQDREIEIEQLKSRDWEEVLERFTQDMDPWSVDIVELANRYRRYVEKLDKKDLQVPARVLVVCAVLLRMKANLMQDFKEENPDQEEMVEEEIEETYEDDWQRELKIPQKTVEPPVKQKPNRRVSLDELKEALDKAIDIKEKREDRWTQRKEDQEEMLNFDEEDITKKLDILMGRLKQIFTEEGGKTSFEKLLKQTENQERLEKFMHLLHLETDDKIKCEQEEFFGNLKIYPREAE